MFNRRKKQERYEKKQKRSWLALIVSFFGVFKIIEKLGINDDKKKRD